MKLSSQRQAASWDSGRRRVEAERRAESERWEDRLRKIDRAAAHADALAEDLSQVAEEMRRERLGGGGSGGAGADRGEGRAVDR